MSQAEDIDAIERYLGDQIPSTPAATAIRDEFIRYMSTIGTYDRHFSGGVYDSVRNFRIRYDRANAVTPAQKQAVETQARGLTTEQMEGGADRRLSTGEYIPRSGGVGSWLPLIAIGGVLWFVTRQKG